MEASVNLVATLPKLGVMVKNLMPGLAERGKIKIGEKGEWINSQGGTKFQPPRKLDYFRVTTLARGADGNFLIDEEVHALPEVGPKPHRIPVRLVYNDLTLNCQSRYACYHGRTLFCSGDGEQALRRKPDGSLFVVSCTCERQDLEYKGKDKCKINGTLSVMIDGVQTVGAVWKFRTTSVNSVSGIFSSMVLIKSITGGPLAGIPLYMTLNPKQVVTPDGMVSLIQVVGLEFRGTVQQLMQVGLKETKERAYYLESIRQVEQQAQLLLSSSPMKFDDDDPAAIIEEFYPDQAEAIGPGRTVEVAPGGEAHIEPSKHQSEPTATTAGPAAQEAAEHGSLDEPTNGGGNGASPATDADDDKGKRRSRRNAFPVDPTVFGTEKLMTCGCTPDQWRSMIEVWRGKDEEKRLVIKKAFGRTGQNDVSFFRLDEAQAILLEFERIDSGRPGSNPAQSVQPSAGEQTSQQPSSSDPIQAQAPDGDIPDDLVLCPAEGPGEKRSRSRYCLVTCKRRQALNNYCPIVDTEMPATQGGSF